MKTERSVEVGGRIGVCSPPRCWTGATESDEAAAHTCLGGTSSAAPSTPADADRAWSTESNRRRPLATGPVRHDGVGIERPATSLVSALAAADLAGAYTAVKVCAPARRPVHEVAPFEQP